jgi:hypothetical protein
MICHRNKRGRVPPLLPPARTYSFGVAGGFVDFIEERDERQREEVRRFEAIKTLFAQNRWGPERRHWTALGRG